MTRRVPATVLIGAIAVLAVGVTSAVIAWRASSATIDAGFWWDEAAPFLLSADDALKIGGPVTPDELTRLQRISRAEVHRAYTGLRINVTDDHGAFWRVAVVGTPLTTTRNRLTFPFSAAGESRIFGPLGGSGSGAPPCTSSRTRRSAWRTWHPSTIALTRTATSMGTRIGLRSTTAICGGPPRGPC